MRRLVLILGTVLCLAGTAAAQNDPPAVSSASLAVPQGTGPRRGFDDRTGPWQVGANFVYQRFDIGNDNSNLYGLQSSVARFLGDSSFAVEGSATVTFGYIIPGDREQLVFYGGGLRYQVRTRKIQPWGHFLAGGTHIRLNQFVGPPSFNGFGLMAGGGVDIRFRSHISWRFEGDFFTTLVSSVWQKNISAGAGIVFTF